MTELKVINYIDSLRKIRKITVFDFTDGICCERQYRRYTSGVSSLSETKIRLFCTKLDLSLTELYYNISRKSTANLSILNSAYLELTRGNFDKGYEVLSRISESSIYDTQNFKYYRFLHLLYLYEVRQLKKKEVLNTCYKYIDIGAMKTENLIKINDLLFLLLINKIKIQSNIKDVLYLLTNIILERNLTYINMESKFILPSLYLHISKSYGLISNYDRSLEVANLGIKYCINNKILDSLPHLYYVAMLGYKHIDSYDLCVKSALKCLNLCQSIDSNLFEKFSALIYDDISVSYYDIVMIYFGEKGKK